MQAVSEKHDKILIQEYKPLKDFIRNLMYPDESITASEVSSFRIAVAIIFFNYMS
jgi:hypothetical protein